MKIKWDYKSVWIFSLVLMFGACLFSYVRVTYADFNGITGQLGNFRKVIYYSNYPEGIKYTEGVHTYTDLVHSNYFIDEIMFDVPSNEYVFSSWNTNRDGSGITYKVGKYYKLEDNLTLYAIWGKRLLGDINLDGKVDDSDYLLLSKHIGDGDFFTDIILSNADVNLDGVIDLVDVDIINQACLGTVGYTQLLSNNPVFIYEIYKSTNNNSNTNNNGGSTGNGSGGSSSNTDGNNNNNSNGNSNKDDDNNDEIDNGNTNDYEEDNDVSNKIEEKRELKNYLWIFLIGLFLISFRIIMIIVGRFKHKNKIDK